MAVRIAVSSAWRSARVSLVASNALRLLSSTSSQLPATADRDPARIGIQPQNVASNGMDRTAAIGL